MNPMANLAWSDNKHRAEPFQSFLHLHKKFVFKTNKITTVNTITY